MVFNNRNSSSVSTGLNLILGILMMLGLGGAASAQDLYQLHQDGTIWRFSGAPCHGNSCPGWQMLDNNTATKAIVSTGGYLYQLHGDGKVWRYNGTPCVGYACHGWEMIDNNQATISIVAGGGHLYQLHNNGEIWRFTGATCGERYCPGWQMIDNNNATRSIVAGGGYLIRCITMERSGALRERPATANLVLDGS